MLLFRLWTKGQYLSISRVDFSHVTFGSYGGPRNIIDTICHMPPTCISLLQMVGAPFGVSPNQPAKIHLSILARILSVEWLGVNGSRGIRESGFTPIKKNKTINKRKGIDSEESNKITRYQIYTNHFVAIWSFLKNLIIHNILTDLCWTK